MMNAIKELDAIENKYRIQEILDKARKCDAIDEMCEKVLATGETQSWLLGKVGRYLRLTIELYHPEPEMVEPPPPGSKE